MIQNGESGQRAKYAKFQQSQGRSVGLLLLLLWLAACAPSEPRSNIKMELSVSDTRIRAGESVVVSWRTEGFTSLTLNGRPVPLEGSEVGHKLETTTSYRLLGATASGRTYQSQADVLVDTMELSGGVAVAALPLTVEGAAANAPASADGDDDIVPGEYLLLFDPEAILPASLAANSLTISDAPHVRLLRSEGVEHAALQAQLLALQALPGVIAAVPNRFVTPLATPNDEHYALQWSLNGSRDPRFDLAPLWETTRGSNRVVIAIVDTGMVQDPTQPGRAHPDLECGRLLPGASFLRAPDGSTTYTPDAFESVGTNNGYHGTHVAGIAAACHQNEIGVVGVDPAARLLPVRVFDDRSTGTLAQVLVAARWAAGLTVPNVPSNPFPADVINFSLGAGGACTDLPHPVSSVLAAVAASGAILVAAAGNTGATNALTPANCPSVISVGAVGPEGQVTSYSNRGPAVDLYAPGGNMSKEDRERGILSTLADEEGFPAYAFIDGTSMASPYVAGLIGLLRALYPNLHAQQVRAMLAEASDPVSFSCRVSNRPTSCEGAVIDPRRLATVAVPPRRATDDLLLSGLSDFGATANRIELRLTNSGSSTVEILGLRSSSRFLSSAPYGSPTLAVGQHRSVVVTLDRIGLVAAGVRGVREASVEIQTNLGTLSVPVRFDLGGNPDIGTVTITAAVEAAEHGGGAIRRSVTTTDHTRDYTFSLDINLAGLRLGPGDRLLIQASAASPAACPGGRLTGEVRVPIEGISTLYLPNLRVPTDFECPPSGVSPP